MEKLKKIIEKTSSKFNKRNSFIFETFVDMSYQFYCTNQSISKDYLKYEKYHSYFHLEYMKLVKENAYKDLLSILFYEYCSYNTTQAMTPFSIADAVSKMLNIEQPKKNKGINICDITCGTGAMLLAAIQNHSTTKKLNVFANDIDELMCKITTVQILTNHLIHSFFDYELSLIVKKHNALLDYENMIDFKKGYYIYTDENEKISDKKVSEIVKRKRREEFIREIKKMANV